MGCLRRPKWPTTLYCVLAAVALSAAVSISPSGAQGQRARPGLVPLPDKPQLGTLGERINSNTISIVSGNINAAWLTIAYDLSAVLDTGDDFRVLPVIGRGGEQNVRDVRYLKGVDLGITVGPVLTKFKASGELGNIDNTIVYITKLFNQEMHVLVRADSGITSLEQMRGKTVNFSDVGSATQQSAREVFKRLNIEVKEVNVGQADAYEAMKRDEMAGTFLSNAMPAPAIARLRPADGFRLIPVTYSKQFHEDYFPATISHEDYPNLIPKGQSIDTIAYGSMISPTTGRRAATGTAASRSSSISSSRSSMTSRSHRVIPSGGKSISPRRFPDGAASMPPRNGSRKIARNSKPSARSRTSTASSRLSPPGPT